MRRREKANADVTMSFKVVNDWAIGDKNSQIGACILQEVHPADNHLCSMHSLVKVAAFDPNPIVAVQCMCL